MRGLHRGAVLVVIAATSLACAKSQPGSCLREKDNVCVESTAEQAAAAKRMCAGLWAIGAGSCPTNNRLGTCAAKDGVQYFYSGAPNNYVAASAKSKCEWAGGGVFTAAAAPPAPP